jgi:adenylate cyclase
MSEESKLPDPDELESLGLYDPNAPDATDRLGLVQYVMSRGATVADVAAAPNLGELALDLNLRPRTTRTLGDVVAATNMEWSVASQLIAAIGLATDPDAPVTADEAAAIELLALTSRMLLGEEATMQIARVSGNAMARVAETLVGAFRLRFELPRRDSGAPYVEVVKEYAQVAQALLPSFVRALDAALRRQIVTVTEGIWSTDDERSAVTLLRTVGFVDLVGYTAQTSTLSVRELIEVLMDFDSRTAEIVARGDGQIVKMIGDEVMFVTDDATDACAIALELVDASGGQLPPVRVGLATGDMVSVFGDLYGPDVNLAARLVAAAEPGTVLVSEQVRSGCRTLKFDELPPLDLKGFSSPVIAYRVRQ